MDFSFLLKRGLIIQGSICKLAGRTLFISGASRGIGKAIALKAARDGANVVVAAKTVAPHPKLPGTIYTAAKEIEEAGGKALPCLVDIRNEEQVESAMKQAADKFGGIDILINNASAISLTGTLATPMKRYDLMMEVNGRGTYLCSQKAIPYLKKSANPHILNISPPLNMKPIWFKNHVAYTMAKYGMSMCVLGMAEELKAEGIAVNALWPKTAILTAAMEMLGGKDISSQCRKPEIVSDSAYAVLVKDRSYTGNFLIDEDVLKAEGITDMEQYAVVPGANLLPDFFLDEFLEEQGEPGKEDLAPSGGVGAGSARSGQVEGIFESIKGHLGADMVEGVQSSFNFEVGGDMWHLDLKSGAGTVGQGAHPGQPDVTMTMDQETFIQVFTGKMNSVSAFMAGKMKIKGNMAAAMKLEKLMKKVQSKL